MAKAIFKASIGKVYILFLLLSCSAFADQLNCIKLKNPDGTNAGTYCKPFSIKAGSNITFSDDPLGRIITINANGSGILNAGVTNKPFIDMMRDCGLKGTGLDADMSTETAAAIACLNLYPSWAFYFPPTKTNGTCSYKFNSTLKPTGEGTTIMGASSGFKNSNTTQGGTVLCWAAGVTGIELDLTGQNCSGCNIKDISLMGSEGTNHLVTPTLLNMPSGANLPRYTRDISSIQRASNVLTVTVKQVAAGEGLTQQVGSTIKIVNVTGDATMNGECIVATLTATSPPGNPVTFTCPQNGSDAGPFTNDGKTMLPTMGASTADGVLLCTNFATIDHVVIVNFGRHGINADSSSADGNCPTPFSDDLVLRDSTLMGNQADGYLCYGADCNAHLLTGNAVYYNVMWGIEDNSSLGNVHVGNQISNNGNLWANGQLTAAKAISSISRTLTSGISQVTVVLSVADANIKLGSCVVIAGVTDSTFNSTSGQCFFINSFTNSTHYGYEQPGAPADASSSSGTSRMGAFFEAYLSSGVDDGAAKIGTQSGVSQPSVIGQYVEGGQAVKYGASVLTFGFGANAAGTGPSVGFPGSFLTTEGCTGRGGHLCSNLDTLINPTDSTGGYELTFLAGKTTDQHEYLTWSDHSLNRIWRLDVTPTGTPVWNLTRFGSGVRRIVLDSTITRLNGESTAAVEINKDGSSGTGGLEVWSGAASPTLYGKINSSGLTIGASGSAIGDSRELLQNVHLCGTTTTCANTANGSYRMIFGNVTLSTGTAVVGSITAFTSTASFVCTGTDKTAVAAVQIVNTSTSSITINGTGSDSIDYVCVGK